MTIDVVRSVDELAADLRRLGLGSGDVVMVHASLRRIGPVEGGAAGVVGGLEQAIGSAGTLLMLLGARDDFDWVNAQPETDRSDLMADAPPFDRYMTPAAPDVGVLAEVLRQIPGTVVNNHPGARFGARGAQARALLAEPLPWDDYYGPGSVLERFVQSGGKVLRLGADSDTVTLIHLAEYQAQLPDKRRVVRHHKVLSSDGTVHIRTVSCLDDTDGIVDWPGEDYFATILNDYLHQHEAGLGKVGAARSELIEATHLLDHAVAWMQKRFIPS